MSAPLVLPSMRAVRAEKARRSLAEFVRQAWHVVEPATPLVWNWHLDAMCEHLQAQFEGHIRQLLINVPPGHMKSLIVGVFRPAWQWLHRPHWRALYASHNMDLSIRDSVRCRTLITSTWYRETFAPSWKLTEDQNVKKHFSNTETGARQCVAIGGSTGFRGDETTIDDPLPADEHPSDAALDDVISWNDFQFSSRLNDLATGRRLVIMQRLHERDLSGHLLGQGGWEHLCLPSEYEPERRCVTSIGWEDPRSERGELLFPSKFNTEVIEETKVKLGSYGYSGQHQQNPTPSAGGIFKEWWWRFWYPDKNNPPPVWRTRMPNGEYHEHVQIPLPKEMHMHALSWDMAFKGKADSDYVCGQAWAKRSADHFLLDQIKDRLDFVQSKAAVKMLAERHPKALTKWIEDKANGPAIISELQHDVVGLIAVDPQGGKEARGHAVAPIVEAGNVYLPHPAVFPWVYRVDPKNPGLIQSLTKFPKGVNDDDVDTLTQALNQFRGRGDFLERMVTM